MEAKFKCQYCDGSGILIGTGSPCSICHGTGDLGALKLSPGYYYSVDILDCINFSEFNALGDNNKRCVELILSAGYVNLNENNPAMIKLFMCFPDGTATCAALLALMG